MGPRSAAPRQGNLQARVLSGMVLGPLVLAAIYIGGTIFEILIVAAALIAVREWVRLVSGPRADLALELSYGFLLAGLMVEILAGPIVGVVLLAGLAVALHVLLRAFGAPPRGWIALGIPYVGLAAAATLWLRDLPEFGMALVYWLVLTVWATDIGAYAAGRTIGGPKLAPTISPNKTWAGLIGGMISAAIVGAGVALAFDAARPLLAGLIGAMLAVLAQGGDLFESSIKRRFGAKDSGRLIPGHGGMLDRMDGFMAAAPVLALFHATLGRSIAWW